MLVGKLIRQKFAPVALLAVWLLVLSVFVGVFTASNASAQSDDAFMIVFDVSASMAGEKLDNAKAALKDAVLTLEPGSVDIGLRSFSGCGADDSTLLAPPEPVDPAALASGIDGLNAGGSTGIETALRDAVADLDSHAGEKTILLVSDGEETCGGDPCGAMASIVDSGVNVVVNTIGFQTQGTPAEPQLKCIADSTGGSAISVDDADGIADAIIDSVDPTAACTSGDLVECFAPELRFHPDETHFPMEPAAWVGQSELKWAADGRCINPIVATQGEVTADNLKNHFWNEQKSAGLFFGMCRLTDKLARSSDFTAPFTMTAANGAMRPVYGENSVPLDIDEGFYLKHADGDDKNAALAGTPTFFLITEHNGVTEIHYWLFYGFDPKSGYGRALKHQGDWEHIVVLVDGDRSLRSVRYAGHGCEPIELAATDPKLTLVEGTHPVVLVAKGSHASWPYERVTSGWPESCSSDLSGRTDEPRFSGGTVLQTWTTGLRDMRGENWYGFGGRWGDTGLLPGGYTDGPIGPPFNIKAEYQSADEVGGQPGSFGALQQPSQITFVPLSTGSFTFLDGLPGRNFVAVLESLPTVVGSGQFDASGAATGVFTVPSSASPGLHKIVVRDSDTGLVMASFPLWVEVESACIASTESSDQDGDLLADICDSDGQDGPNSDFDGDGVANGVDNCPTIPNPDQAANGLRSVGNACNSVLGVNPVPSYPIFEADSIKPTPTGLPAPTPTTSAPGAIYCPEGSNPIDSDGDGHEDQCDEAIIGGVVSPEGIVLEEVANDPKPVKAVEIGFTG